MKLPKILSEKDKQEKERRKSRMMTAFIIFVLMASTAAFALTFNNQTKKVTYHGYKFIRTENGWQVKGTNLITTFLPGDVENISSPDFSMNSFKSNVYFLARTNPEMTAANELNRAFYQIFLNSQLACSAKYENDSFCSELPIKNCGNESDLIIEIEEAENQSIIYENNCIKIKGNEYDLIKSADRIIFSAYGIISK